MAVHVHCPTTRRVPHGGRDQPSTEPVWSRLPHRRAVLSRGPGGSREASSQSQNGIVVTSPAEENAAASRPRCFQRERFLVWGTGWCHFTRDAGVRFMRTRGGKMWTRGADPWGRSRSSWTDGRAILYGSSRVLP